MSNTTVANAPDATLGRTLAFLRRVVTAAYAGVLLAVLVLMATVFLLRGWPPSPWSQSRRWSWARSTPR